MMIIKEARLETGGQRKTEDQRCSDFSGCWTELWWNRGERRAESASMASNDLCSPQPASVRHWTKECQARALPSLQPRQRNSSSLHSPSPYHSPLLSPPSPPLYHPPRSLQLSPPLSSPLGVVTYLPPSCSILVDGKSRFVDILPFQIKILTGFLKL